MSSGERNKNRGRFHGVRGWEEAGCEFFQESYPGAESDLEVMQNDPQRICTLLPSKKTRCGTLKDQKLSTFRHRTAVKSKYQMTVNPNAEIQLSLLPDLSENLSNEKLLWEEIMKIKDMPINMSQKKELKTKLLSKDTLRLQGFKHFKWKKKQSMLQLRTRLSEFNEKLTLWRSSLKKIEGFYGTGIVSFFLFLKWLIFLNIILSLIMCIFVVLPTFYVLMDDAKAGNSSINVTDTIIENPLFISTNSLLNLVFDSTIMNFSPLYYSFYSRNFSFDLYYFKLNLPVAYLIATLMCLSYSFISVIKSTACGFRNRLLESQGQYYLYCDLVFSGWDFCIQSEKSAKIKHKALHNEIMGRLVAEKLEEEKLNRNRQQWLALYSIRLVINVFILILLSVAGYIIFISFESSRKLSNTDLWYLKILIEFEPTGLIVFFNFTFPYLFHWLAKFENFSPIFSVQVTIFRTITLKFSSLCILLASVYEKQAELRKNPFEKESWESYMARELYKVLLLSIIIQIIVTFFLNLPRSLIAKHCKTKYTRCFTKPEFYLPTHILDIVYIQTIIWLGLFYSPLLPMFGVVIILAVFYIKKFACLVNCKPAFDIYCASRSHSLYMFILLISFTFSVIPLAYSIVEMKPSTTCGPFLEYGTVWEVVENVYDKLPKWMNQSATFCISSAVVVPLVIILALTSYYYYAVYLVNKHMVVELKQQLVLEGHDKQFLLNRLSAFMKQQQEKR